MVKIRNMKKLLVVIFGVMLLAGCVSSGSSDTTKNTTEQHRFNMVLDKSFVTLNYKDLIN